MNIALRIFILILILALACALRFYNLGSIPAGLHADAASQGYNAFSLLNTGKDRYSEFFPILFRAFGYYQPPLYTYLSIIPVAIFGNSPFAARFISALSGTILVLITYLLVLMFSSKNRKSFILPEISALVMAIVPWSVFFSRMAVEANLGLLLFILGLALCICSLKKIQILPIASIILGISTHAYYSERLIVVIFLPLFLLFFRKILLKPRRWLILAILLFAITQIPHLLILQSGAFTNRFDQVSYFGNQPQNQFKIFNILTTINNNYLIYFSPKNLFFDSDINLGRTMPGLSVFYNWFLIPFIIGIWYLLKNQSSILVKIIILLLIITPISASVTGDFFYPLRLLDFLWVLTIVISIGLFQIYLFFRSKIAVLTVFGVFFLYSLFSLYISYFILFKYEKAENYGYAYIKLMDKLSGYNNKQIIVDSARDPGIGVRIAYLKSYPPQRLQNQLHSQLKTPYYSNTVNTNEIYELDNITVKPLNFGDACKSNVIIVGDRLAISSKQLEDHNLKQEFEILDLSGKSVLFGYSTHPKATCIKPNLILR